MIKEEDKKMEKQEEKKEEANIEGKPENAKAAGKTIKPKEEKHEAIVKGESLPISTKHAIAICNFIKNKSIQEAISGLEQVTKLKIAIPFKGEIPHRHGRGMASGRYPINATKQFIKLLKNLSTNAVANGLDTDSVRVSAKADISSRRRFGRKYKRFKRTDVLISVKETGNPKMKKEPKKK